MQAKTQHITQFVCFTLTRGVALKLFPMCAFAKHRIELAKQKLREKLSYEYIASLPKYKGITRKQYEQLIDSIETLCLVLIESYCRTNSVQL